MHACMHACIHACMHAYGQVLTAQSGANPVWADAAGGGASNAKAYFFGSM